MVFLNLAAGMPAGSNGSGQRGRRAEAPADLFSKEKEARRKEKDERRILGEVSSAILRPGSRLPAEGSVRRPRASAIKLYEIRVYKVNVFSKVSENFIFYPLRPHAARAPEENRAFGSWQGSDSGRAGGTEQGDGAGFLRTIHKTEYQSRTINTVQKDI